MAINSANDLYISINDELRPWSDVSQDIIEYLKRRVEGITHALVYKGSVEDLDALNAIENPGIGDMYNVVADKNANYAWNGSEWDSLGPLASTIDPVAIQNSENAIQSGFIYDALMNYATYNQVQAIIDEVFGEQSIADITRNINQQFSDMNQDINDIKSQIAGYPDTLISEDDNNAIVLGTDHKLFVDNSENAELATQIGVLQNSVTTNTNNISNLTQLINNYPEYSGATSEESGTAGLVPPALSDEKDYFLKGDGTWSEIDVPTISIYQGATSEDDGVPGLVPSATSEEKDSFLRGDGNWSEIEIPVSVTDITNPNCLEKTIEEFSPNVDMYTAVTGYTEQEYDDFQNGLSVTGTPILDTNTGLHQNHENYIRTQILYDIPYSIAISVSLWNLGDDDITSKFSLYNSNDEDIDINTVQIPLIPLQTILDAGDDGIELYKNFGVRNADKLIVKCTDNQDGTYTFTYVWRNSSVVPSFDLTFSNGTQKTINMPCIFDIVDEKIGSVVENLVTYQGATTDANGIIGLVPAPQIADKNKYLKGDGTWSSANTELELDYVPATSTKTISQYTEETSGLTGFSFGAKVSIDETYVLGGEYLIAARQQSPVESFDIDCSSIQIYNDSVIRIECHSSLDSGDFWLTYTFNGLFDDLINAGEDGLPMRESNNEGYGITPLLSESGKKLYISCTDKGNGVYSLYPFIVETELTPAIATLIVDQPDGTTSNVDLSQLITDSSKIEPILDAKYPRIYITNYIQLDAGDLDGNWSWQENRLIATDIQYINSGNYLIYNDQNEHPNLLTSFELKGPNYNYFRFNVAVFPSDSDDEFYGYDSPHKSLYCDNNVVTFGGYGTNYDFVYHPEYDNGTLNDTTVYQGNDEYTIPYFLECGDFIIKFKLLLVYKNNDDTVRKYNLYAYYYPITEPIEKPVLSFKYNNSDDIQTIFSGEIATKDDIYTLKKYVNNLIYIGATKTPITNTYGVPGLVPSASWDETDMFLKGDGTWSNTTTMLYEKTSEVTGSVIDLSKGSIFAKTVTANTTFSISHNIPSGYGACFTLILTNGGNYTVNWPNTILWTENTAPDLTENGRDVLTFITYDSGTTWYGTVNCSKVMPS